MQIVSIEPTPNPNSMKLTIDEALPEGKSLSFARAEAPMAPPHLRVLLAVAGVQSVYQVADFIAVERQPQGDWQKILAEIRSAVRQAGAVVAEEPPGKVSVYVQMLRGIPMQIKLRTLTEEIRVGLPERFGRAAKTAAATSPDFLAERRWEPRGVRYGELAEVGAEVAEEIAATYDEERVQQLLDQALALGPGAQPQAVEPLSPAEVAERLRDPDWRHRYAALERLEPSLEGIEVIVDALRDSNPSVRRLATVYLGEIGEPAVLPHLFGALRDPSAAVRRAAGDCLSDIGDPSGTGPMAAALSDPSKLVRWRAARFLYEAGDASALPALRAAEEDPEFEVRLQIRMAIERIEEGRAGVEPAWKQMTRQIFGEE